MSKVRKEIKINNLHLFVPLLVVLTAALFFNLNFSKIFPFVKAANLSDYLSGGGTITLEPGSYYVNSDLTIPANVILYLKRGAVIKIASGVTLSIDGKIQDCLYQIFEDNSANLGRGVKFSNGNMSEVRPEWWGARGNVHLYDGNPQNGAMITANSNSIEKAIHSHRDYKQTVVFATGKYWIGRTIVVVGSTNLKGQGDFRGGTEIKLSNNVNMHMVEDADPISSNQSSSVSGITFTFTSQSPDSHKDTIHLSHGTRNWHIQDCLINWPTNWGIYIDGVDDVLIENSRVYGPVNGSIFMKDAKNINIEKSEFASANGECGIYMENCDNVTYSGNFVWCDTDKDGRSGLCLKNNTKLTISENSIGPWSYGIKIISGGAVIKNNNINNYIKSIYAPGVADNVVIENNKIIPSGSVAEYPQQYGISFENKVSNSTIRNNTIIDWKEAAIHFSGEPSAGDYPLIEDNLGVDFGNKGKDLGATFPILESSPNPSVTISKNWKTANASPITITNLAKVPAGKEAFILFGDDNTTINFYNNPNLKSNNGLDWKPTSGDHMRCTKEASSWSCKVFNDTGNARFLPPPADLNEDLKIDQLDFDILKADFQKLTESLANSRSDIDSDGQATIKDVGILMSGWR